MDNENYSVKQYLMDTAEDLGKAMFGAIAIAFLGFALYLWEPVISSGVQQYLNP